MKVYISADIEGTTAITNWDETEKSKADHAKFAEQMSREVKAACQGAIKAGAKEIWVNDAHDSGRNLDSSVLPKNVKIIRGWAGHPFSMVQELDNSFDAVLFTGYHSHGGSDANPLAHTMNPYDVDYVKINGEFASEFTLHAYAAAYVGVPAVFVSGDKGLCEDVKKFNKNIKTVAVNEGKGASTISIHPDLAVELIEKEVEGALKTDLSECKVEMPGEFNLEIGYITHAKALRLSYYPGAKLIAPKVISFSSKDYFEILRAVLFLT